MPKLHIPGLGGRAATACARQLNNHRASRAQDAANATVATSLAEYSIALQDGKACRHCGRAVGLLPKLIRTVRTINNEESEGDE